MSRNNHQNRNLAARMGSWSAAHWKTATFGWLALVVVAFGVGGQVGTKNINPNTSGPGESGRMDRILQAGFKLPANESVLIQSRSVRAGAPAFDCRRRRRRRARLEGCGRPERQVAARCSQRRSDLEGRAFRARRVRDPGRPGQGRRQARPGPRRRRPGAARAFGLLHRRVRRGKRCRRRPTRGSGTT